MNAVILFEGQIPEMGLDPIDRGDGFLTSQAGLNAIVRVVEQQADWNGWESQILVERRGHNDAMGEATWIRVYGEVATKILSLVSVLIQVKKVRHLEARLAQLEGASMTSDELAGSTVTVPGAATGEPPQS